AENAERREGAELELEPQIDRNEAEGQCQHRRERAEHGKDDGDRGFPCQASDVDADEPQQRRDHQRRPFTRPMSKPMPKAPTTTPNGLRRATASNSVSMLLAWFLAADAMPSPMSVAASPTSVAM